MKYFKMKEFECRDGCEIPASARENIEALVDNVLDPVREAYCKPISVNSGYRCAKHNAAVGGVPNSQHMRGEAVDIAPVNSEKIKVKSELERLVQIIKEQGTFDQLIVYPTFVHVSYKRIGRNRKQIIYKHF